MATIQECRAYKEVLIILEKLNLISEIPENIINLLKTEQDNGWGFVYDEELELEEQNILRETAVIFSNLYLAFICKDVEEKEQLKEIYMMNQKQHNETKVDDWKEKLVKQTERSSENVEKEQSLITENEKSFLQKITEFFKKIFR